MKRVGVSMGSTAGSSIISKRSGSGQNGPSYERIILGWYEVDVPLVGKRVRLIISLS